MEGRGCNWELCHCRWNRVLLIKKKGRLLLFLIEKVFILLAIKWKLGVHCKMVVRCLHRPSASHFFSVKHEPLPWPSCIGTGWTRGYTRQWGVCMGSQITLPGCSSWLPFISYVTKGMSPTFSVCQRGWWLYKLQALMWRVVELIYEKWLERTWHIINIP